MNEHAKTSKFAFWLLIIYFIGGGGVLFGLLKFQLIHPSLLVFVPIVSMAILGIVFILAIIGLFAKNKKKIFSYVSLGVVIILGVIVPKLVTYQKDEHLNLDGVNKQINLCYSGDGYACYLVASSYEKGNGVNKNIEKAMEFYVKAFENNITKAGFDLGAIYGHGILVKKDHKKSAYYYKKSCTRGYIDSCYNLANSYYHGGRGVEVDKQKAQSLYLKACFGDDFKACSNYLYVNKSQNRDVSIDPSVAGTWEDDHRNNWIRAFNILQPSSIEIVHSKYWRSAHWTKEFAYYFELKLSEENREALVAELTELKESKTNESFWDKPAWFLVGAREEYRTFSLGSGGGRVFLNNSTGHIFVWDSQI